MGVWTILEHPLVNEYLRSLSAPKAKDAIPIGYGSDNVGIPMKTGRPLLLQKAFSSGRTNCCRRRILETTTRNHCFKKDEK
jgi:hypothetical protein